VSAPTLDIIVPIYNEESALPELIRRVRITLDKIPNIAWKLILVENGCTDSSHEIIEKAVQDESRIIEVRLTRNFGTEGALYAGLSISHADACITMQGDLEDPPELIPNFIKEWQSGMDLVYGEVADRKTNTTRKFLTACFYWLANYLTDGQVRKNASDFRLISRSIREFLLEYGEQEGFLRSLVTWPSNKVRSIPFARNPRVYGRSHFKVIRIIIWSLSAIVTLSLKPIRAITFLGLLSSLASLVSLLILCIRAFFWYVPFPGFGTIVGLQVLFFGLLMLSLGVVAEYVAHILIEVRPRPRFLIASINRSED